MSVRAMTWVWEYSRAEGNSRLVLLAIADNAHDDGRDAWPSQETLSRKCRISVRTVRRAVADLVELGELEVEKYKGPRADGAAGRHTHRYFMPMLADNLTGNPEEVGGHDGQVGGQNASGCGTRVSGEPSEPLSKPSSSNDREEAERNRLAAWMHDHCEPVRGRRASLSSCRKLVDEVRDERGITLYETEITIGQAIEVHDARSLTFFRGAFEPPPQIGPRRGLHDFDDVCSHLRDVPVAS